MPEPLIELCVEGIDGMLAAQAGGADRIELCASLLEGGITPSAGVIREALRRATVPVNVIVRPRGGDFLYSEAEFAGMVADVEQIRRDGAAGVVVGCLTEDGRIDEVRTAALVAAARPLSVTCHRAFDMTRDPEEALMALIRCGVDRVLTSGQRSNAIEGLELLTRLVALAGDRIVIMGCGALRPDIIGRVRREAGLREMHFSAPMEMASGMRYRNPRIGMGGTPVDREYIRILTDPDLVARTIQAARDA